jgi:HK97 family phage major capsid protein
MPMPTQDNTALSAAATKALNDVKEAVKGFASKRDLEELQSKYAVLQQQCDAIDVANSQRHLGGNFGGLTLEKMLGEDEGVSRFLKDRGRGRCVIKFEGPEQMAALYRKTIVSGTGSGSSNGDTLNPVGISTSGVLTIDRQPGIVLEARQRLTIENVLSSAPTTQAAVDFVRVSSPMSIASPVAEGSVKPEQSMSFTSHSEKVRTIASWIPSTKQVLDDLPSLMAVIQGSLLFYLGLEVELQLISGDSSGESLNGLIHQASSFNSALLPPASAGWQRIDVLAQGINQIGLAMELDPTFVVLNTSDYWKLRLTKNSFGSYILGNPNLPGDVSIFGLTPIHTTSIAQGSFLIGSGSPAAASVRNRQEAIIEISDSHASFFTSNLLAIRGERRLCLMTMRPGSFITGSFSTSPAS